MSEIVSNREDCDLRKYYGRESDGDEILKEAEQELYQRLDPIKDDILEVLRHHVRFNDAKMTYEESKDFILKTLGELL